MAYQWEFEAAAIPGATDARLTLPGMGYANAGSYRVVIESPTGQTTSRTATVGLLPPDLRILKQPDESTVEEGGNAGFAVLAVGDGPLTYQWFKDGEVIEGATASNFAIPDADPADEGVYHARVTSPFGAIVSSSAELNVFTSGLLRSVWRLPRTPGLDLNASFHADGVFVVGGQAGYFALSTDGINWQGSHLPESMTIDYIFKNGGNWIFFGTLPPNQFTYTFVTPDFETWSRHEVINSGIQSLATDGRNIVAAGLGSMRSVDGFHWEPLPLEVSRLEGVAWANNRFVAGLNDSPGVWTSPDGVDWTRVSDQNIRGSGLMSDGDWIYHRSNRSRDGITWESSPVEEDGTMVMAKGIYARVDFKGFRTSSDGINWTNVDTGDQAVTANVLLSAVTDGSIAVVTGKGGLLASGPRGQVMAVRAHQAPFGQLKRAGGALFFLSDPSHDSYFSWDGIEWARLPNRIITGPMLPFIRTNFTSSTRGWTPILAFRPRT